MGESDSSRRGGRTRANELSTDARFWSEWNRLAAMTDADIDYSDIDEMDDATLASGVVVLPGERIVEVAVEEAVADWYAARHGAAAREALREYMRQHASA